MFAIWLPVLAGDNRGAIDRRILEDPRVLTFWDPDRIVGDWFGGHSVGGLGGGGLLVWDAFFAFGEDGRWQGRPTGAVAAGSPIIGNVGALERRFLPLVRQN